MRHQRPRTPDVHQRRDRQRQGGIAERRELDRAPDQPQQVVGQPDAAVQEAAKTLRGITGADVVSMSALVENERISEYRTTVNIAFAVERGGSGGG